MKTKPPARRPLPRSTELSKEELATVAGGFLVSEPSDSGRVIERHEPAGNRGGFEP
jgi:hypothetical protein